MLLLLSLHVLTFEEILLLQNPFGSAKPRETVLAAKLGKKEEDILKEELSKDRINVNTLLDSILTHCTKCLNSRSDLWTT